jgi:dihydrofolate reductase
MRRIINSTYVTLDGAVERPHHWPSLGGQDDDGTAVQTELLLGCDAVLMGRRTYEGFAPVWPTRSGDPYSDRINSMEKLVVSTTLGIPEWNNTTVIRTDPIAEITRLKAGPGKNIVQYGFGQLSRALVGNDLLDELRLWVHPLFVGDAPREDLIAPHCPPARLTLTDTRVLKNGIVILTYGLARNG